MTPPSTSMRTISQHCDRACIAGALSGLLIEVREQTADENSDAYQPDDNTHRQHDHRHTQAEPDDHHDEPDDDGRDVPQHALDRCHPGSAAPEDFHHGPPPPRNEQPSYLLVVSDAVERLSDAAHTARGGSHPDRYAFK